MIAIYLSKQQIDLSKQQELDGCWSKSNTAN